MLRSLSPQEVILNNPAGMPEVEQVREKPMPKFKALILTKSRIIGADAGSRKKFLVTMKQFTRFDAESQHQLPVGKSRLLTGLPSPIVLE